MVWVPLSPTSSDHRAPLRTPSTTTMSLEWLMDWSWSLDGLRDFIATGIQSFRDCDATALVAVACLLVLFVWYCYHVGREQPRAYATVNALMQSAEVNGVQNGFVYCHSPECVRCSHHDGLNQKLYHNLQEYAKRYSWSGMGRIHKGIREQGRYLNSRPSIQKPEVFFLPDLPTMPYFSRDAQKHDVELLERNFQTILCEFETLYKAFSNCSLPQGWKMNSTPSGEWFTFYLVNQGMCVPRNCRRCPRTYRLLGSLRTCIGNNVFGNACISVLSPGTVIAEHYGPTNIRIRCHLGLKTPSNCELVVGGEPQCWAEGRCLLFDDSFLHTAFHEGEFSVWGLVVSPVVLGTGEESGCTHAQSLLLPQQGWSPCVQQGSGPASPASPRWEQPGPMTVLPPPQGARPPQPPFLADPWSPLSLPMACSHPDLLMLLSQHRQPSTGPADPLPAAAASLGSFLHYRALQGSSGCDATAPASSGPVAARC
uniref:Aspartate beta-hydroxylase domain-containing protein 2 n=4 Tax=Corvus TaxID=30420 RepID=A0A8C3EJF1_CORMO